MRKIKKFLILPIVIFVFALFAVPMMIFADSELCSEQIGVNAEDSSWTMSTPCGQPILEVGVWKGSWGREFTSDVTWHNRVTISGIGTSSVTVTEINSGPDVHTIAIKYECMECPPDDGDLRIMKYSGDQRLAGAVFDVSDGKGFSVQVTTGEDGFATVPGAPDGILYVKEVVAPEDCEIDPNQYTVEVINGKGEIHIENDCPPPPKKKTTEEPPAEEPEVEVLAFTGQSPIFFIGGFALIAITGGLIVGLRLRKVRK